MQTHPQPAVFFDMDGVLIDSEPVWQEAIDQVFGELGIVLDASMKDHTMGMGNAESMAWVLSQFPGVRATVSEVCRRIDAGMLQRINAGIGAIPGAADLVRELAGRGVPLALVSTSGPLLMQAVVRAHGFDGWFRVVLSSEDVGPGKPDPAVYREAIRRMQADPQQSLAIEDTVNGARSAHGAGLRVIGFTNHAEIRSAMQSFVWQIAPDFAAIRRLIGSRNVL